MSLLASNGDFRLTFLDRQLRNWNKIMESSNVTKWQTIVSSQNPELLKKAQEELKENPATRDQDIQKFREMVLAEEDLESPIDDAFLLKFLRARKFDHERALKLLKRYFSIRIKVPELFSSYRPSLMRHVMKATASVLLPQCDQLGRKIMVFNFGRWNPSKETAYEHFRLAHIAAEYAFTDEATQVHGVVGILDAKDFGLTHAAHVTPSILKSLYTVVQDCIPARVKAIHLVFHPVVFTAFYCTIKPFLNKKISSRIFLHGYNLESLHEHIHPECLPKELGGLLPPIDYSAANEALLAKDDEIADRFSNFGYNKK